MKLRNNQFTIAVAIASSMTLAACSDSDDVSDIVEATTENVSINFAAQINGADFTCGQTYTGVGTGPDDFTVQDFRMFVHDAHIHDELTGEEYEIELNQDGMWQLDNLALLDFEDATADCTGTAETNTAINGTVTVPVTVDLSAAEVCFEVGVPADKNHLDTDALTTAAPLTAPGMHWPWKVGMKYVRIDGTGDPASVTPVGFNLHLGAQGCPGSDAGAPPTSACTVPNTFEVCIHNFDVENSVIAVDPAFVFESNDVSVNLGAADGCQSFIDDDDCEEVMPRLGLDYSYGRSVTGVASSYTGEQKLFSKQ